MRKAESVVREWFEGSHPDRNEERKTVTYRTFFGFQGNITDMFSRDLSLDGGDWFRLETPLAERLQGVWVNASKGLIFTYTEGDGSLVDSDTPEDHAAEVARIVEFYRDM